MAVTSLPPLRRTAWRRGLLWAVVCCLAVAAPLQAVPFTIPTDLAPGDHYRLAFVTSTWRDATSSNIAVYNAFVTAAATAVPELAALGTTWTAIASTPTVNARQNTSTDPSPPGATGAPIYLLNNTRLADDYDDLWNLSIDRRLNVNQDGTFGQVGPVWTGTTAWGDGQSSHEMGRLSVEQGVTYRSDEFWVSASDEFAGRQASFYGLSGDLVVPAAVPEPGTFMLLGSGMVGLLLLGWRRARRRAVA